MTDDVDLTEVLQLEREAAVNLADVLYSSVLAAFEGGAGQVRSVQANSAARTGQMVGQVNLASLTHAEVNVLQLATSATRAAVNLLVLDRAREARDCFRVAASLVAPFSSNDSTVLALCADAGAMASGELGVLGPGLSDWLLQVRALFQLVGGLDRDVEFFSASGSSRLFGGAESAPPEGLSLERLIRLRDRLLNVTPSGGPQVWEAVLLDVEGLLIDSTSLLEEVIGGQGWGDQSGSLLPIEPEVLLIGLIESLWRQRGPEFGVVGRGWSLLADRERLGSVAFAVSVAATRLLTDEDAAFGG